MFKRIAENRDSQSCAVELRRKRFAFFQSLLSQLALPLHILDIGGIEAYWQMMELKSDDQDFIALLNLSKESVKLPSLASMAGRS